jgi:hypothetical protein
MSVLALNYQIGRATDKDSLDKLVSVDVDGREGDNALEAIIIIK